MMREYLIVPLRGVKAITIVRQQSVNGYEGGPQETVKSSIVCSGRELTTDTYYRHACHPYMHESLCPPHPPPIHTLCHVCACLSVIRDACEESYTLYIVSRS